MAGLTKKYVGYPTIKMIGTWNATTNVPDLTALTPVAGDGYVVVVAGNTDINGETNWGVRDIVAYLDGQWQKIDNTDDVLSVNGKKGAVTLVSIDIQHEITKEYIVDMNRDPVTEGYTADGSITKPFKTIQAAIDVIAVLGLAEYISIKIKAGIYKENLVLEDVGLKYIIFETDGYVSINPDSGNALQTTADNDNLVALYLNDINFAKPIVLTGSNGASSFADVMLHNVNLTGTATLTANCINNISFKNVYAETAISFTNVVWSNIDSGQIQGNFTFTADSIADYPVGGKDCTIQVAGIVLSGSAIYVIGGTGTYTIAAIGSRWGKSGALTIPAGVTIYSYNSFIRGSITNNGSISLRGGTIETYVGGTGTLNLNAQPASQIKNDSDVTGTTTKDALNTLNGLYHVQNTDSALRTDKLTVDVDGNTVIAGELKIKQVISATEPTLTQADGMVIWKESVDEGVTITGVFLIIKVGDFQYKVEFILSV